MPLTRDQVQEIKSILKTSVIEILNDKDFKEKLVENLSEIFEKKLIEQEEKYNKKIRQLEEKIDSMEQYSRRKNIRIYGMVEDSKKNVTQEVDETLKKLNLEQTQVVECYRIGKIKNDKPRSIFVKFSSYEDKLQVMLNRKKLKGTRIHIKEDLTKIRIDIMKAASTKYGFKNVWSTNGKIFAIENGNRKVLKTLEEVEVN